MNKESCIKAVRGYLNSKGLEYCEYETQTGSIYFHVAMTSYSNPCIRISDHHMPRHKKGTVTLNIIYTQFSKRLKAHEIKNRVVRSLENAFEKSQAYSLKCAFKQI